MIVHRERTFWGKKTIASLGKGLAIVMVSSLDSDPSVAIIHDLVVHRTARRKGLGDALLRVAEREAGYMGASVVRLSVEPGTWQVDWYKRHGYQDQGEVETEGYNFVLLEKEIRREAEEPLAMSLEFR